MNWFYLTCLVAVSTQIVFGVPLLSRVKRQLPEETNQLPENGPYAENDAQVQDPPKIHIPIDDALDGAANSIYRKYHMAPGYEQTDEQPSPVVPDSEQPQDGEPPAGGIPVPAEQGNALPQPPQTGGVPSPDTDVGGVPPSEPAAVAPPVYEVPKYQNGQYVPLAPQYEQPIQSAPGFPQNQLTNVGGVPQSAEPPVYEVPQYQNGQYVPVAPQYDQPQNQPEGDANQQPAQLPGAGYEQPAQLPGAGYEQPAQLPGASGLGFPQNQHTGDANQQYGPYVPPELPGAEEPLQQPIDTGLPQNQFGGVVNQQYIPPQLPGEGPPVGEPLQPEGGLGIPPPQDQDMDDGTGNSPYETAPGYQNIPGAENVAGQGQPPIPPIVPTSKPVTNVTEQFPVTDYDNMWPNSDYVSDDQYPDGNNADNWVDQYYSYNSESSFSDKLTGSLSFNLFDNGGPNNDVPSQADVFDVDSSNDDGRFDPYESVDDESYENLLKQEIEDFKNIGLYGSAVAPKGDSPSDRLQPGAHWQINNSQPPSTLNTQATSNFLLYCIPAILLTLVLYIGYTNYHRRPKIVHIPSGNNWRAEYRDIEAKSKEIEPMLRKAEMY